jgi:probable rRNA maturation factor
MILNRQRAVRVVRRPLQIFLQQVERELGLGESDVTICLVSDAEIARMNEAFRGEKGPTDVLSFPAEKQGAVLLSGRKRTKTREAKGTEKGRGEPKARTTERYLGDIAIAPLTARRYAKKNGRSLNNELRVLILHGVLHLMGYDHETDRGEMNRIEQKLRKRFGLT